MRGLAVLFAFVLIGVGLIVTFATLTVNGWLMLAVVGMGVLAWELHLEDKAVKR